MCCPQSRKDFINTANGSIYFLKKHNPRKLVALTSATKVLKYLKPEGEKQENKTKLEQVGCSQVWFPQNPRKIDERRDEFSFMHNRKLNGCQQRLLFALRLIPRKCSHTPEIAGRTNFFFLFFFLFYYFFLLQVIHTQKRNKNYTE